MVLRLKMSGSERSVRTTGTRLIKIENRRTGLGRNSFYMKAAKIWNSLPPDIRKIDSKSLFKKKVKTLLQNEPSDRLRYF